MNTVKLEEGSAASAPAPWYRPERFPELEQGAVHVWRARVADLAPREPELLALLDGDERSRAQRFYFARDRTQYVLAHGMLRTLLGSYFGAGAETLRFQVGAFGKPSLVDACGRPPIDFNLSHSGDLIVCGFARNRPVGVDVERWNADIDHVELAAFCFSAAERAELDALPAHRRNAGFFNAWSRKEAYLKGTGLGVSQGLDHFDVSLTPGAVARLLADRHEPAGVVRWSMRDLALGAGYSGTVVAAGSEWQLDRLEYPLAGSNRP